ncbi:DAK2 domain-containing protein [Streptomyces sp. H27-D2]|uniref:DAK2 domain-containing protein n=1 Tax=Streptomyces sp. H27-D2 TaxID=3046304 RepID=UPI002DB9110B|nr:DAK2 domain-containing protein [Streptomyces sp. H27-D2]MEC4017286.1 DAK2 domain-containing protein [Streptomyces sp. H27-D2]
MPQTLDATAVRTWCGLALEALGQAREEIDAINVYPVADGDTGTNLYLTVESATQAVDAAFDGLAASGSGLAAPDLPTLADAMRAMAHGALIGARGNSGTILAQLLRGMAEVLAAGSPPGGGTASDGSASEGSGPGDSASDGSASGGAAWDGAAAAEAELLRKALRTAAESAFEAVAHPVEGTVLTVAAAAAAAGEKSAGECGAVAHAAYEGACVALDATPGQLAVLGRAGVVDAGGYGLVAVLGALAEALSGVAPRQLCRAASGRTRRGRAEGTSPHLAAGSTQNATGSSEDAAVDGCPADDASGPTEREQGPAFEVIYLLEAGDAAVARLRARLDGLGDSLVVVGGDGLWNVHVHVDDAGAAVEAGIEAGRPYRIRVTHLASAAGEPHGTADSRRAAASGPRGERAPRAIVAVLPGDGLAALCTEAGARVVSVRPGEPPASGELVEAIRRAHAREVVLLPNDPALRHTAAAAAEQARTEGVRVALIPTRSAVQGIAALAVHEPGRRFDEDVVAMTSAAGATRYAELAVAEHRSWTMAGICQAGDVLGLIDGDVAVIGSELAGTAVTVLDRMLAAGGEMVTLVIGADAPDDLAARLEAHVREVHLAVDTVVYRGGQQSAPLLIGVE